MQSRTNVRGERIDVASLPRREVRRVIRFVRGPIGKGDLCLTAANSKVDVNHVLGGAITWGCTPQAAPSQVKSS